jgi:hypothetical protein
LPGREWISLMPRTAQPRSSHASTKALPLSRFCARPRYVTKLMRMAWIAGAMVVPVLVRFT